MSFETIGERTVRLSAPQKAELVSLVPASCNFDLGDPAGNDLWVEWLRVGFEVDPTKSELVRAVVSSLAMFDSRLAADVIDCILDWDQREFLEACFLLERRPESLSFVRILKPLLGIARIEGSYHGPPLGAGEVVLLFMVVDASCSFGGREDVSLMGEKWHVKKMKRGRTARMGTSSVTCYGSSETAFKLSTIDREFANKITEELLDKHTESIERIFGSMKSFREELTREALTREFSACVGICVFDPNRDVLEFHRKDDIECANPKQGRYNLLVNRKAVR